MTQIARERDSSGKESQLDKETFLRNEIGKRKMTNKIVGDQLMNEQMNMISNHDGNNFN